jgi:hypothetical protein
VLGNKERIQVRIETLAKYPAFNDEMFIWLCKDIIADSKRSKDPSIIQNTETKVKELIHERRNGIGT